MTKFSDLNISPAILQSVNRMGFEEATPVQAKTIPLSLQGLDLIGQAQTGTGKTAAFGIPLIEKIDVSSPHVQGIIIAPTRELAIQVSEELYKIGQDARVRVLAIYGGSDIQRQIRSLKRGPHIIVGTPGRILDHIKRRTLKLGNVHTVILDEADEMLNMGFVEDIEAILGTVPEERQTLLFSATMPEPIRRIANRFMKDPELVKVQAKEMTVPLIEQFFVKAHEKEKFDILSRLIDTQSPELAIVFGRTKRRVDELANALTLRGYTAEGIHGDLTQAKRMSVLKKFKEGRVDVLVATDVAARGLDISGVTHVYNYDIPQDPESYVHRIGRTGRAGKEGMAITFVNPREMGYLRIVEQTTKKRMTPMEPPTWDEAMEGQQRIAVDALEDAIRSGKVDEYRNVAKDFLAQFDDPATIVAAALKLLTKEPDQTPVHITEERPLPSKGDRGSRGGGRGGDRNRNRNRNDRRSGDRNRRGSSSYGKGNNKQQRSNNNRSK